MCLCLAGRLGGDEVAEPRAGRCGLLRDHHAGSNRAACCRRASGSATGSGATSASSTRWSASRRPSVRQASCTSSDRGSRAHTAP